MVAEIPELSDLLPKIAHDKGTILLPEAFTDYTADSVKELVALIVESLEALKPVASAYFNQEKGLIEVEYGDPIPTRELFRYEHPLDMIMEQTVRENKKMLVPIKKSE